MQDLVSRLLPKLKEHRLPGLEAGSDLLYPFYQGYSLANLPDSACHWLGVPALGIGSLGSEILDTWQREFRHVVVLLVDGLGLNIVQNAIQRSEQDPAFAVWAELAQEGLLAPITTIAPSTTSAALTTLWTGRPPSAHGVVGYEVYLKEYSLIANMILHSPTSYANDIGTLSKAGFDPQTFLPTPTLGPHLQKNGVRPYALQYQAIARSGLSQMLFQGVDILPFRTQSDFWVTLSSLLDSRPDERNYIYIYWGDLDDLMHRYSPEDPRVQFELAAFSQQFSRFIRERKAHSREDTLFILTADHGHISTPRSPHYELRNHPALLDCLVMLPSGEARLPLVFLRPGRESEFLEYVEKAWPGEFTAVPAAAAINSGLFGAEIYNRLPDRVGDYVMIPHGSAYWWFPARDSHLLGRHGGLSPAEMLSPFLGFVF